MLKNDQQYKTTLEWIEKFKRNVEETKKMDEDDPLKKEMLIKSAESMVADLENQASEYLSARDKTLDIAQLMIDLQSIDKIADNLTKLRIYLGLTQEDLAQLLGKKKQQIQRWEKEDYMITKLHHIRELIDVMKSKLGEDDWKHFKKNK